MHVFTAIIVAFALVACRSGTPSGSTVKEGELSESGANPAPASAPQENSEGTNSGGAAQGPAPAPETEKQSQAKIYNYMREDVLVTTPTHPEGEIIKPYKGIEFIINSNTRQNGSYLFSARTMTSNQSIDLSVPAADIEGGGWGAAVQLINGALMIRQNKAGAAQGGAGPSTPITPR